ncbi:MAG: hypothetical protein WCB68_16925 [Pyrinomonadaceae bacterium]
MPLNDNLSLDQLSNEVWEVLFSGMRSPRVKLLPAGLTLFRFASSDKPPETWAAGAWWIADHDYRKILAEHRVSQIRHRKDGLTLGYLARAATAVRNEWSLMDIVVKAIVREDVMAFVGYGHTQHKEILPNGMYITIQGWPEIEQIFIPNISDRNGRTLLGYKALQVQRQKKVSSQRLS